MIKEVDQLSDISNNILNSIHARENDLLSVIDHLKNIASAYEEDNQQLKLEISRREEGIEFKKLRDDVHSEITSITEAVTSLVVRFGKNESTICEINQSFEAKMAEINNAVEECKEAKDSMKKQEKLFKKAIFDLNNMRRDYTDELEKCNKKRKDFEALCIEVSNFKTALEEKQEGLDKKQEEIDKAKANQVRLNELESNDSKKDKKIKKLEEENAELEKQIQALQKEEKKSLLNNSAEQEIHNKSNIKHDEELSNHSEPSESGEQLPPDQ